LKKLYFDVSKIEKTLFRQTNKVKT